MLIILKLEIHLIKILDRVPLLVKNNLIGLCTILSWEKKRELLLQPVEGDGGRKGILYNLPSLLMLRIL